MSLGGGSAGVLSYELPASNWTSTGGEGAGRGYRYADKNRGAGPFRSVSVKPGRLVKAAGKGSALGLTLAGNPDPVGVTLAIGGARYCMAFGGDTRFRKSFVARNAPAPAPATCVP
jgi:hypothetical protein